MSSPERKRDLAEPEEAPAKRVKTKDEDRARGKRLFGNLLGTLQKIQRDDQKDRGSEAAKRREQVAERIQQKIVTESNLHASIAEAQRELRSLIVQTDSQEATIKQTEATMRARHATLLPTARFLHTAPPESTELYPADLTNPAPIPLNLGPKRDGHALYYVLLPEQQERLAAQIAEVGGLVDAEKQDLVEEKARTREQGAKNKERIAELEAQLSKLRNHL